MTTIELLSKLAAAGIRLRTDGSELRYEAPRHAPPTAELMAELARHKTEVIRFLRSTTERRRPPLDSAPADAAIPLSFAQQRFYFLDRLEGPGSTYNLPSAFLLEGSLNVPALVESIAETVRRHSVLRTIFVSADSGITQQVTDRGPDISFVDLTALEDARRRPVLDGIVEAESRRPFDIPNGPHMRVHIVRLATDCHALVVNMHHVVSDGASILVFVRELHALYEANSAGRSAALAPLPIQYRDWAYHQQNTSTAQEHADYWRRKLDGIPALVELPLDRKRPPVQTFNGASVHCRLDTALLEKVERLRERLGVTPFHCLFTAFIALLHKYSGQSDVVAGTLVANRQRPELEPLIGPFFNVLPVRSKLTAGVSMLGLLDGVRQTVSEALDHADLPFEQVVDAVRPERSPAYSPIFNVLFAYEDVPVGIMNLPGLKTTTLHVRQESAKFDLTLVVQADQSGTNCWFKYNTDLFEHSTIERLAGHYFNVLAALADTPSLPMSELCLLTAAERSQIEEWNSTDRPYAYKQCVHWFFERQAAASPDAIALDFEDATLTYGELNACANRLAHFLIAKGVGAETMVGICAERSLEMVIGVLGVLKAGGAYVPIDPEYPAERQRFMLDDARVNILLTLKRLASSLAHAGEIVELDPFVRPAGVILDLPDTNPVNRVHPRNASYVIYTSGSTGLPKAVVTDHSAICNNLLWMQDNWPLSRNDSLLLKAAFSFDVSFKEIMWPLMFGARLVIARPNGHRDPAYVHSVIADKKITVIHLVPTMLEYFLNVRDRASARSLRIVMCGGEALTPALKERFCREFDAGLLHLYGPTEAAVAVTGTLLTRNDGRDSITLGRPMANCRICILDQDLNPVPVGVSGELFISGVPLARGYHNRPELTAEKFLPDPFSGEPGGRMYRSGDLARYRADGEIEFLGRIDGQVKLRGLRLELGEIENALRELPSVRDCIVNATSIGDKGQMLAAYVVPADGRAFDRHEAIRHLKGRLPGYMVPASYTVLDRIPISPNGKADRAALPPPAPAAATENAGPESDIERRLLEIWRDLLGTPDVSVNENFFDAGGHSMLLLQLQNRIRTAFGREIAVSELFQHPTVAGMAQFLSGDEPAPVTKSLPARIRASAEDAVAIIGMAGRFPGAADVREYWRNIAEGQERISFFSDEELLAEGLDPEVVQNPKFIKARGYLPDVDLLDAEFFHVTPTEAQLLDPQFRLLFESVQHAFDDAGYAPDRLTADGKRVGVYVSVSRGTYFLNNLQTRPDLVESVGWTPIAISSDKSFAATQISYKFNLRGPSILVDTACSSSLVAAHQACRALLEGECELALAGGASVDVPGKGGYLFQQGNIGSQDGHCRPFDKAASGTVKGNGAGVVLLKRLSDALRDNDHIYAAILGSAINNDGSDKVGFTAPSVAGQAQALAGALESAGLGSSDIGYIETHGTGTKLGDPIEVAALASAYREGSIALGAVKAAIGHLDAAAGIAGLIKAALVVHHRQIPPAVNFTAPNPEIDFTRTVFRVPLTLEPWPQDRPLRAGVSSFGIGGTNAHLIVGEAPPRARIEAGDRPEVLAISARSEKALRAAVEALALSLEHSDLSDIAFTLNTGRREFDCRRAFVCQSRSSAIASLRAFLDEPVIDNEHQSAAVLLGAPREDSAVMFDPLLRECAVFAGYMRECTVAFEQIAGVSRARAEAFARDYAALRLLGDLAGRSLRVITSGAGEWVYGAAVGTLPLEQAARLWASYAPEPGSTLSSDTAAVSWMEGSWLDMLAMLWQSGVPIDWRAWYESLEPAIRDRYRRVPLPGYPFERKRYWIDAAPHARSSSACMEARSWTRATPSRPADTSRQCILFAPGDGSGAILAAAGRELEPSLTVVRAGDDFKIPYGGALHIVFASNALESLLELIDVLAERNANVRLDVITREAFSVVGHEDVSADSALLAAAALAIEARRARVRVFDVSPGSYDPAALWREIFSESESPVTALRGRFRWIESNVGVAASTPVSLTGKTCVVWNGLTPFGLKLAEFAARRNAARIVLSGNRDQLQSFRGVVLSRLEPWLGRGGQISFEVKHESADVFFLNLVDGYDYLADRSTRSGTDWHALLEGVTAELSRSLKPFAHARGFVFSAGRGRAAASRLITRPVGAWVSAMAAAGGLPGWISAKCDLWTAATDQLSPAVERSFRVALSAPVESGEITIAATGLPEMADVEADDAKPPAGDFSSTESRILEIWKQVIGKAGISLDDDFFEAGGDSLLATQVGARVSELFGVSVSPDVFYEQPTVRALAAFVDAGAAAAAADTESREELVL